MRKVWGCAECDFTVTIDFGPDRDGRGYLHHDVDPVNTKRQAIVHTIVVREEVERGKAR